MQHTYLYLICISEFNIFDNLQKGRSQHGRVLGGSSSINWMLYVRGHKADYDSWEELGCVGWNWENVEKYFKKMENYIIQDGKASYLLFTCILLLQLADPLFYPSLQII